MCLVRFGSSRSAATQEPQAVAPRPAPAAASGPRPASSSSLPVGTVVQNVAPRRSGSGSRRSQRSTKGYYVDAAGRKHSFSVGRDAEGRTSYVIEDGQGRRTAYVEGTRRGDDSGATTLTVEPRRHSRGTSRPVTYDAEGRRRTYEIGPGGTRRNYLVAADGRRVSFVELDRGSEARATTSSQVIVIEQRSPRASSVMMSSPRLPSAQATPRSSGVLVSPPASPRAGLGLGELEFPADAAAGSLKVVRRRRSSSRSPRTSRGSLQSRGADVTGGSPQPQHAAPVAPPPLSPRAPPPTSPGRAMARDGSSRHRRESGGSTRSRPISVSRQRLDTGYELRTSDGELVRVETMAPSSPRAPYGGSAMSRVRSESSGVHMARAGSGGVGMARTASGGMGMARTGSAGVGMTRTTSGGVGMARTNSGVGMARTASGGVGMARTGSGGTGMARTTSGPPPSLTPSAAAAIANSAGAVMIRSRSRSGTGTRPNMSPTPMPSSPLTNGAAVPTAVPRTPVTSSAADLAAAEVANGATPKAPEPTPMIRTVSAGGGTMMARIPSAGASRRGHARSASASDPRASGASLGSPGRRERERVVVVDGNGGRVRLYR